MSGRNDEAVRHLCGSLAVLKESTTPVLKTFVTELRALFGSERALAYNVRVQPEGFGLEFGYWSGFPLSAERINAQMAAGLQSAHGRPWALYDPKLPSPRQRNIAVQLPAARRLTGPRGGELFRALGVPQRDRPPLVARMKMLDAAFLRSIAMADMNVCRALICDGDSVLGWIGACQSDPFDDRDLRSLNRLIPALLRRLRVDRLLGAAASSSALPLALEAVPSAAFVVSATGAIEHVNAAGRALIERQGEALRARLMEAIAQDGDSAFAISATSTPGLPPYYLAIHRPTASDPSGRLQAAIAEWSLTPRQGEVLAYLARGDSTRSIAAALGCVTRTIEVHVTRILASAGVSNRGALIARFWSTPA